MSELLEIKPKTEVVTANDDLIVTSDKVVTPNDNNTVVQDLDNTENSGTPEESMSLSGTVPVQDTSPQSENTATDCDDGDTTVFKAIGVIEGEVSFGEKNFIKVGDKEYQLFYSPKYKKAWRALQIQVKRFGAHQKLVVHPRPLHLPDRNKQPTMRFQLVGFGTGELMTELAVNEFKLSGWWQFIPCNKFPILTVARNFDSEQYEFFKSLDSDRQKRYFKATHIPLVWRDASVQPFRFNPRLEKDEQQPRFFVQLKARFLPEKGVFGFESLVAPPSPEHPKYIKVKKPEQKPSKDKKVRGSKKGTSKKIYSKKNGNTGKSAQKPKPKQKKEA